MRCWIRITICAPPISTRASPTQPSLSFSPQELVTKATFTYRVIRVDEEAAANVVYINSVLLHLDDRAIPQSFAVSIPLALTEYCNTCRQFQSDKGRNL